MDRDTILDNIGRASIANTTLLMAYMDAVGNTSEREVEPYSFRETDRGEVLFYAFCYLRNAIRGFKLDNIISAEVTENPYDPKWEVEIN